MTPALLIAIVLSLTAWTVFVSKKWRYRGQAGLGLMSQEWIAEQRSDESRHRLT